MILSTLIASFGLISNSTATVIGAMLVAPLMGPILGLALSLAKGRSDLFTLALKAETMGIVVCLLSSGLVAWVAGAGNIDYLASEIAGRTQPTLYDMAIGLAAGLAGAYATVNPRVGDSIGGVAIAVALVPPLSVTGLCLSGALSGRAHLWTAAGGSFMLFLANFLTIELAAAGLFLWVGLGHIRELLRAQGLLRGLGIQLVLLLLTLSFLATQLNSLLNRRQIERQARQVASIELAGVPGASLDSLDTREVGGLLDVEVVIRSPREIEPALVERMQHRLTQSLGREVELGVGTILSTYYTSEGRRYAPRPVTPDPEQLRRLQLSQSLQKALAGFPSAELDSFRLLDNGRALVTVRSPYEFDGPLVERLETSARKSFEGGNFPALTVRTLLSRDFTDTGPVPSDDPELAFRQEVKSRLTVMMTGLVDSVPGSSLLELRFELVTPPDTEDGPLPTPVSDLWHGRNLVVQAVVRSTTPLSAARIRSWRSTLQDQLNTGVQLEVDNRLGHLLVAPSASPSPAPAPASPSPSPR